MPAAGLPIIMDKGRRLRDLCTVSLWTILLVLLLLLLIGILFTPVRVIVDTLEDRYELRVPPWAWARLLVGDGTIGYEWRAVHFVRGQGQLFPPDFDTPDSQAVSTGTDQRTEKQDDDRKKAARRSRKATSTRTMLRMGRALLRSFRVRRLHLRVDTGNAVYNAWLFPFFAWWNHRGYDVAIRFAGGTDLVLDMSNSVHRIAGALIREFTPKPFRP